MIRKRTRMSESVKRRARREGDSFVDAMNALRKYKENTTGVSKLTYDEVKKLREAWSKPRTRRLVEADMQAMEQDPNLGMDQSMGQGMDQGMDQSMGGAVANVDPVVQSQIQSVIDSVDSLAASVGLNQENDLDQNPDADVGPIEGQPVGAPEDGGMPQSLGEAIRMYRSWKRKNGQGSKISEGEIRALAKRVREARRNARLAEETKTETPRRSRRVSERAERRAKIARRARLIRERSRERNSLESRIAARKERIAALQEGTSTEKQSMARSQFKRPRRTRENGAVDYAKKELSNLGVGMEFRSSLHKRGSDSEFGVKVPSADSLANGHAGKPAIKPADRWPTKKVPGKALQGSGSKMTERSVTDIYVDNFLSEDKLSFDKIKESMKNGILG